MADIASDHLFLRQRLLPVLLCTMVVIVMHHGPAAVVPELCRRHRGPFQVPAQIFDASPGSPGLLRKVDFPAVTSGVRTAPADSAATVFYRGYAPVPATCRD